MMKGKKTSFWPKRKCEKIEISTEANVERERPEGRKKETRQMVSHVTEKLCQMIDHMLIKILNVLAVKSHVKISC